MRSFPYRGKSAFGAVFFSFLLVNQVVVAQELLPYRQGTKWGLSDSSQKIVVKCEYDDIGFPENGKVWIKHKGKTGMIATNGKEFIEPKYKSIGNYHDGLAVAEGDNKFGYLGEKGELELPLKYEWAGNFNRGFARIKNAKGRWELIDKKGKNQLEQEYEDILFADSRYYLVKQDRKWGAIHYDGKPFIECKYDSIGRDLQDYKVVRLAGKYGLVNAKGAEALACRFDEIIGFDSAFLSVKADGKYGLFQLFSQELVEPEAEVENLSDMREHITFYRWKNRKKADLVGYKAISQNFGAFFAAQKEDKWAILDTNLNIITDFHFDSVKVVSGLFGVRKNDRWGLYNPAIKNYAVFCRYAQVRPSKDGTVVVYLDKMCGLIDTAARLLVPCIYDKVEKVNDKLFLVALNGKYGLINEEGKALTPFRYQDIDVFGEEYALLQTPDNKTGLYDLELNKISIPAMFDELSLLRSDLVMVKKDGDYGLMDRKGKMVSHFQYSEMIPQSQGRLLVRKRDKIGWLDSTGRLFIPCKYDSATSWFRGYVAVKYKGKWGMIDSIGKTVIPFEYRQVMNPYWLESDDMPEENQLQMLSDPSRNLVWVQGMNNFWGLMDTEGHTLVGTRFDSIFTCTNNKNLFITKLAARYGLANDKDEDLLGNAYTTLYETSNGYFVAQQGTRFALISAQGQPITPFKYQEIQYVENDKYIWVLYDNQRGLINLSGKEFFEKGGK